jgi:hypothetical protein
LFFHVDIQCLTRTFHTKLIIIVNFYFTSKDQVNQRLLPIQSLHAKSHESQKIEF